MSVLVRTPRTAPSPKRNMHALGCGPPKLELHSGQSYPPAPGNRASIRSTRGRVSPLLGLMPSSRRWLFWLSLAKMLRSSFFPSRDGLALLEIDPGRLGAELRYENGYPHIYGPLNPDAVVAVRDIPSVKRSPR